MGRTDILRGPAIIQYKGATFWSQGDITVDYTQELFGVEVSNFGQVDQRVNNIAHRITFTPAGQWAPRAVLLPYATALIGSSVFGADTPLTIWALNRQKRVYKAAALTKMPTLTFAATKPIFGAVEFTCLHADAAVISDANSLYTDTEQDYPGDVGFSAADILTQPYEVRWGDASPWASFWTREGVTVEFGLNIEPEMNDRKGVIDYTFQSLTATATFQPEGPTQADIAARLYEQGAGASRGRSLHSGGHDLAIVGTGVYFLLSKAALTSAGAAYGATTRRVQPIKAQSTRSFADGVAAPLFAALAAAPEPEEDP